jgi:hypothetical protein
LLDFFMGKDTKVKQIHQRLLQVEAYWETWSFTSNKEQIHFTDTILKENAWDWWTIEKQKTSNLFEVLIKKIFKLQLNEIFMMHYLVFKDEWSS